MNYPDDIRSYDRDPRSPFYQEVVIDTVEICWCCDKPEDQCECEDGFDARDAYCSDCSGDCGDCNYVFSGDDQ